MNSTTAWKRIVRPLCDSQSLLRSQRCKNLSPRTQHRSSYQPSSTRHQSSHHASRHAHLQSSARNGIAFFAVALIGSIAGYQYFGSPEAQTLNDTKFIPYRISSREAISPTSFVITLSPTTLDLAASSKPYLYSETGKWKFPLWSVEFKQPEVQIARHYTPLPPKDGEDGLTASLKFYIRTVGDGEMSNYLGRLRVNEEVFMRGPHRGFDVLNRLGSARNLVVLAGGTGVVPGLQAAEAVLSAHQDAKVKILWAVRKREELQMVEPPPRAWFAKPAPTEVEGSIASPSPVGKQMAYLKKKYGDRFSLQLSVDEEGSFFSSQNISAALVSTSSSTRKASQTPHDCQLHSQNLHVGVSEFEASPPACSLGPEASSSAGKNLLLVSGPEGFVGHFAGTKRWAQGTQVQGPLGGVIGQLQTQNGILKDEWLVLKL